MKKKGITLIEMIATIALIIIVIPLIYSVYENNVKLNNEISTNVYAQSDGRNAVNEISQDIRVAKLITKDYENEINKNFDRLNFDYNKDLVHNIKYYFESLTSDKPFAYALVDSGDGLSNLYKLYLSDKDENKKINFYQTKSASVYEATEDNINHEFGNEDNFEDFVLRGTGNIKIPRNRIIILNPGDQPQDNGKYIALAIFEKENKKYIYYIDDKKGIKYFAKLIEKQDYVPSMILENDSDKKLILSNIRDFAINHEGIAYNIYLKLKVKDGVDYSFNVDVNPIYLGGED